MQTTLSAKNLGLVSGVFLLTAVLVTVLLAGGDDVRAGQAGEVSYIDTHAHVTLFAGPELDQAVKDALATMESQGIQMMLIMPVPLPPHEDEGLLPGVVAAHPEKFAFLGGGKILNQIIQGSPVSEVTSATLSDFELKALDILRSGGIGFGEMVGEHFSLHAGHPHISAQPDHPLFLLLADIAARYDVPIDLHMEALTENTSRDSLCSSSNACWEEEGWTNPNPGTFYENITALEALLSHNRNARIVWVHAGWDNTGQRTVKLMRRLLGDHPNLYVNIKFGNRLTNRPLDGDKQLRAGWLDLIRSFPDRFTIGTDGKFSADVGAKFFALHRDFLDQLPPDLARKVGYLNAIRIYNLNQRLICHGPSTQAARPIWVDASSLQSHLRHGDSVGPC